MRILQINAVNGFGSTGRNCLEISNFLEDKGYVSVVACSHSTTDNYNIYKIGNTLDTKIHAFLSRLFGLQGYFSIVPTIRLIIFIKKEKFDIVHLNNLHGNFINIPILLKNLGNKNIPTVITLHDCFFYTGKCCHYTVNNCYKWQTECNNCKFIHLYNKSWFFDRTKKMWHDKERLLNAISRLAIIGVSDWITNEVRKSFLSNAMIIKRIYNWIDLDVFKPVDSRKLRCKLGLNEKFVVLGVASKWSDTKGLKSFIELANRLDGNYSIILIGLMPNIHLPSNIISIPNTNDVNKLVEFYSLADVFVTLSLEETFGKVSSEALACGTPLICCNSTANPELVGQNCGYVVDKGALDDVVEKIKEIYKNHKDFYTNYCINYAKANFGKEKIINEYIDLYKELIK